jgi:hypothetical protein
MLESYAITYVLSTVSGALNSVRLLSRPAPYRRRLFIFWIVLSVNLVGDGLSFRGRLQRVAVLGSVGEQSDASREPPDRRPGLSGHCGVH